MKNYFFEHWYISGLKRNIYFHLIYFYGNGILLSVIDWILILDLVAEFSDCDQTSPNCVVIGDAVEGFSYENMNKAFQLLFRLENPILISMGKG